MANDSNLRNTTTTGAENTENPNIQKHISWNEVLVKDNINRDGQK